MVRGKDLETKGSTDLEMVVVPTVTTFAEEPVLSSVSLFFGEVCEMEAFSCLRVGEGGVC